jgi:hypothetical protein
VLKMALGPLSPFPQLLPHLNECLNLAGAGKSVVDQAAILEAAFVEFPYAASAQMREVVTKLLKLACAAALLKQARTIVETQTIQNFRNWLSVLISLLFLR